MPNPIEPQCECKACLAGAKMQEIHTAIIRDKRDPTDEEQEQMALLMEDILSNGKFYL
jgi:hypothetical protein